MHLIFKTLLASTLLINFSEGLLLPIYAIYAASLGGSILSIAIIYAAYYCLCGILFLFTGKHTDRVKMKEDLLIVAYSIMAFASLSYTWITNTVELFFVQILLGFANTLQAPAWTYFYATYISKDAIGTEAGYMKGGTYIMYGLAISLGGLIVSAFGFDTLFYIMAAMQGVVATALLIKKPFEYRWFHVKARST